MTFCCIRTTRRILEIYLDGMSQKIWSKSRERDGPAGRLSIMDAKMVDYKRCLNKIYNSEQIYKTIQQSINSSHVFHVIPYWST